MFKGLKFIEYQLQVVEDTMHIGAETAVTLKAQVGTPIYFPFALGNIPDCIFSIFVADSECCWTYKAE